MAIEKMVEYLVKLAKNEDRGALASLRRLASDNVGATAAYRHVLAFVPEGDGPRQRADVQRYLQIAGLFGVHPHHHGPAGTGGESAAAYAPRRNMGHVMAEVSGGKDDNATERRFLRMLESHEEELPTHLRHAISMAAGAQGGTVGVDYVQLYWDLRYWTSDDRKVQLRWARSYYHTLDQGGPQ